MGRGAPCALICLVAWGSGWEMCGGRSWGPPKTKGHRANAGYAYKCRRAGYRPLLRRNGPALGANRLRTRPGDSPGENRGMGAAWGGLSVTLHAPGSRVVRPQTSIRATFDTLRRRCGACYTTERWPSKHMPELSDASRHSLHSSSLKLGCRHASARWWDKTPSVSVGAAPRHKGG